MFESNDAVASVRPEGAHASALTVLLWPVGIVVICKNLSPDESGVVGEPYEYNRTVLSAEQEARRGLVGFHAICHALSS